MNQLWDMFHLLRDAYEQYKPNDEAFLSTYPELQDQINALDALDPQDIEDTVHAIDCLTDFLEEWFPDSVDDEEQETIRTLIDKGYQLTKEEKK